MGKDTRLVNIYLKIHHKKPLTMDDLAYLAKYAPECFEKTCKNVVYNFPEAKPIMEPAHAKVQKEEVKEETKQETLEQQHIEKVLDNLKRLEIDDFPVNEIDADKLKNLLGNLYMEMLFPHNDRDTFMNMSGSESKSLFDKKV
ncbi:MAG: hypothetical protein IJO97_02790 [Lachnospiraceae bacterium]|nr:hypothetical protein [Lachnospiraceae bacterium]